MSNQQTIVVTGAASGIGAAAASLLVQRGHRVVGIDRSECPDLAESIRADLSTSEGVSSAIALLPEQVDGICNVAGVPGTAPFRLTMAVNVNAVRALCDAMVERMPDGGSVVNVASLAGSRWAERLKDVGDYLAVTDWDAALAWMAQRDDLANDAYRFSKECIIVHSGRMAGRLLSRGIRVNSVSPGPVETPIFEDFKSTLGRQMIQDAVDLVGRAGSPDDIAPVIAFLVDKESAWVNGVDIKVDGGLGAHRTFAVAEVG